MYFGYGTCTVILICFNVLGHWGFVCLLPGGVYAKIFGYGAFIYGVVPVTVTTITWSGACVRLNLFTKTWGVVGLGLRLHLFCVSGTRFVNCYRGVT